MSPSEPRGWKDQRDWKSVFDRSPAQMAVQGVGRATPPTSPQTHRHVTVACSYSHRSHEFRPQHCNGVLQSPSEDADAHMKSRKANLRS